MSQARCGQADIGRWTLEFGQKNESGIAKIQKDPDR